MSLMTFRRGILLTFLILFQCEQPLKEPFATEPLVKLDLTELRNRGTLRVLVDNNSVSYFIFKGTSLGFEYELLSRLARYLNLELKIKLITSIEEAIDRLNKGEGDIIAFPLTVTTERRKFMAFTDTHFMTTQVLVQRKSMDWRANPYLADKQMLRNPADLIGKEVWVKYGSAFKDRLQNLSQEIGGEIIIHEDTASNETESLIRKVSEGVIDYTVADQTLAMVNAAYYPNIDIHTALSLPQQIAWGVRKNSTELLQATNSWLADIKRSGTFNVIFRKYFESPRTTRQRLISDYSSLGGNKISDYDELLKQKAEELGWDWRLLASLIYKESTYDPKAESWAGAVGLMQLMPETGKHFGAKDLTDPVQNINAGVKFLQFLDRQWKKRVPDDQERIKFILASYNVGLSHVIDAWRLAEKYGPNPQLWDNNVEYFLREKSNPKYYRDPIVTAGYCRCTGPVNYVKEVLARFEEYKLHITP